MLDLVRLQRIFAGQSPPFVVQTKHGDQSKEVRPLLRDDDDKYTLLDPVLVQYLQWDTVDNGQSMMLLTVAGEDMIVQALVRNHHIYGSSPQPGGSPYWFRFDVETRTWSSHPVAVSSGHVSARTIAKTGRLPVRKSRSKKTVLASKKREIIKIESDEESSVDTDSNASFTTGHSVQKRRRSSVATRYGPQLPTPIESECIGNPFLSNSTDTQRHERGFQTRESVEQVLLASLSIRSRPRDHVVASHKGTEAAIGASVARLSGSGIRAAQQRSSHLDSRQRSLSGTDRSSVPATGKFLPLIPGV